MSYILESHKNGKKRRGMVTPGNPQNEEIGVPVCTPSHPSGALPGSTTTPMPCDHVLGNAEKKLERKIKGTILWCMYMAPAAMITIRQCLFFWRLHWRMKSNVRCDGPRLGIFDVGN